MRRAAKWTMILLTVCGVVGVASDRLTACGYDFWRYSAYQQQLEEDTTLSEALDARLENSEERLALKELIVREFLAGRTTFDGVIDSFRQTNEGNDRVMQYMHTYYPAADDREIAARNALQFIGSSLPKDSPRRGPLLGRLRAEFDRQFPQAAAVPL